MVDLIAETTIRSAGGMIPPGGRFRCPKTIAGRYVRSGQARYPEPSEHKVDGPSAIKDRSWTSSGSWKTLREGGDEVDTVQCTKEEAEGWADGTLSLDDIT